MATPTFQVFAAGDTVYVRGLGGATDDADDVRPSPELLVLIDRSAVGDMDSDGIDDDAAADGGGGEPLGTLTMLYRGSAGRISRDAARTLRPAAQGVARCSTA